MPKNYIKDDFNHTVDGWFDLTAQEQAFLAMLRKLPESDRAYLLRVAEVMVLDKNHHSAECSSLVIPYS